MTTIAFDTHKFIQTLQQAGFEQKQAEAVSRVLQDVSGEAGLIVQSDLDVLRRDMRDMELRIDVRLETIKGELTLIKWMLGILLGGVLSLVLKSFF